MFLIRGEKEADKNIVIVDIDEKSLKELGQWPWSRDKVATILKNLTSSGAGIIGLDIVFAEPDNSSPKRVLEKLNIEHKNAIDYDEVLAMMIAQTPTVVGYVFALQEDGLKAERSPKSGPIFIEKNKPSISSVIKAHRPILNIAQIQDYAYANGYFNTVPDRDGMVRSIPMIIEYDQMIYPSLSLEMIRLMLGEKKVNIEYYENQIEQIRIGEISIPTDMFGRMRINYRGPEKQYKYISAIDIYNNTVSPEAIANKIILLGTSAAGLLDLRSTPFDSAFPGVEVHANAIDNIINADFLAKPSWIIGVDLFSFVLVLLLVFGILLIPNALISFALWVSLNMLFLLLHYKVMFGEGILLHTFIPLTALNLLFLVGESINYYYEIRQKNRIKGKFATKVSSLVVDELIKTNDDTVMQTKEKEITIFFSDIRGFTSLSESMNSAKELIALLNEYMTPMVDIIIQHKGTVDKFIGDAIMAYWNAPLEVKNHADKALTSAIEQIQALHKLNQKLEQEKKPSIDIGIGLNSGLSVVGEMGSVGRSDYTCIGDSVNLASRAEGLCKNYGAKIIFTEHTKYLLKNDDYLFRELDTVRVKGKENPIKLYECFGNSQYRWNEPDKDYEIALDQYAEGKFDEAIKLFQELNEKDEQKLYKLYIQRCEFFIKNPHEKFDGIFTHDTK